MKKFILSLVILILSACAMINAILFQPALADNNVINQNNYQSYGMNYSLYSVFCALASEVNGEETKAFSTTFFSSDGEYLDGSGDSEDARAIVSDLQDGVLNLTTGANADYACLKNKSSITSISGLNQMSFDGIEILVLNDNSLQEIGETQLNSFVDLKDLYINNNRLTNFGLSSYFSGKIEFLSLNNNSLKKVNLSCMRAVSSVNLASNLIANLDDISLSQAVLEKIDLRFNSFTSLDMSMAEEKFGCTPLVLVQNLKSKYELGEKLSIFNDDNNNLQVHVAYSKNSQFFAGERAYLSSTTGSSQFESIVMPAGKITVSFSFDSLPSTIDASLLNSFDCEIKLPKPEYEIISDGKKQTSLELHNNFDISFSIDIDDSIANKEKIDQSARLYSFLNNSTSEIENNIITIVDNGSYTFSSYAIFDGIRSDTLVVRVTRRNTTGIVLGAILALLVIIGVVAFFVLRRWFRDGGTVAPLSDREINRYSSPSNDKKATIQNNSSFESSDFVDLSERNKSSTEKIVIPTKIRDENDFPEDL